MTRREGSDVHSKRGHVLMDGAVGIVQAWLRLRG
jgi:hypothetical protein